MLVRMVRHRWSQALAAGPLLMLFALAPSVMSLDHWSEYLGIAAVREEDPLEHAGHCHFGPATCSDQPLPPDLSATPAVVQIVKPELTLVALEETDMTTQEHVVVPPTEPPRS